MTSHFYNLAWAWQVSYFSYLIPYYLNIWMHLYSSFKHRKALDHHISINCANSCNICGQVFKLLSERREHLLMAHGKVMIIEAQLLSNFIQQKHCCKNPFLVAWLRKCLILRMHLLSILASFYKRSYSITKAKCWYEPYELRLYGLFFLKGVVEALVYSSEGWRFETRLDYS